VRQVALWVGLAIAMSAVAAMAATPAPAPRTVVTEAINPSPAEGENADTIEPPDTGAPGEDAGEEAPDDGAPPAPLPPTEIPVVEYDLTKLPTPVARLREQIIEAAKTGDPEKLRVIIDANEEPPQFGPSDTGDPIGYLKLQSGDADGREMLAILIEVLDAGYVHVDVGTPDEMYIWPYFARYPIDKLSPPQLVELFKLVYAGDYEDMLAYGIYTYFRVGIAPDGTWRSFVAND
jgi:hypothetical protein